MTSKVRNHFSEAHFDTISRFFSFWSCHMAEPYGRAIWQSHMARPYGKAIWQGHMAKPYGKAIWQSHGLAIAIGQSHMAAAAAAFRCNGDVKLFAGTLPLKIDMLKMQKSHFY